MCWICKDPLFFFSPYRAHRKLVKDYQARKGEIPPGVQRPGSSLFPGAAPAKGAPQNAARGANRRNPENARVIEPVQDLGREKDPAIPPPPPVPPAPVPAHPGEREEPQPLNQEDIYYDDDEEEELPEIVQQDEATKNKRLEIMGYLMPLIHEGQALGINVQQANKYVAWTVSAHNIQELNEAHALQFKQQLEAAIAAKKAQG